MNSITRGLALAALTLLPACSGDSATTIARNDDVFALASTNVVREHLTTQTVGSGGAIEARATVGISRQLEPRLTTLDMSLTQGDKVTDIQMARTNGIFLTKTAGGEWVEGDTGMRLPNSITAVLDARIRKGDLAKAFTYEGPGVWMSRTVHSYTGALESARTLLPTVSKGAHAAEVSLKLDDQGFVAQLDARIDFADRTVFIEYQLIEIEEPILSMGS